MIKHGNGWRIDGKGGMYPKTFFRVIDTITGEAKRITNDGNNRFLGSESDALSYCEENIHSIRRLAIEKVEVIIYKPNATVKV